MTARWRWSRAPAISPPGSVLRLYRSGFDVVMTEIAAPTVVRRTVAFAEAVWDGEAVVEGVTGVLVASASRGARRRWRGGAYR